MLNMFQALLALNDKPFAQVMSDYEKFPFLFSADEQFVLSAFFAMAGELDE